MQFYLDFFQLTLSKSHFLLQKEPPLWHWLRN
ncbi:hypothetical protein FHS56_000850 [Thermonema lapsum]|uniref:Uncharacterized protein n=1 Tax=Thermonema lapsum TaxID=28195 RepID=A0A846MPB6_9BACT|nr:hypothetical protein [Thermonema lapsum]